MVTFQKIQDKVKTWQQAKEAISVWKLTDEKIVFTNGCFDLLHYGHIHYLSQAKDLGDRLIVGVNSDQSVARLKGPGRPIKNENTRLHILATFSFVDTVVLFENDTPYELIKELMPDVLVKGGDWQPDQIVGADLVAASGGEIHSLPFIEGYSTTNFVNKIKEERRKS